MTTVVPFANFDPETGQYTRSSWCDPSSPELNAPNTYRGVVNIHSQYHDLASGKPVDMPPRPSGMHDFEYRGRRRVLNTATQASPARGQRNAMLQASDWTQLADVPPATRAKWQPYRQALRDLPARPGFPSVVEWPSPPDEN